MNDRHPSGNSNPTGPAPDASYGLYSPYDQQGAQNGSAEYDGYAAGTSGNLGAVYGDVDPLFGAIPGSYGTEGYPAAQYAAGAYENGQYPAAPYDYGQYPNAQYPNPQYGAGPYETAQYGYNAYETGQYPVGQYDESLAYENGQYDSTGMAPAPAPGWDSGAQPTAGYDIYGTPQAAFAAGDYDTGSYDTGGYDTPVYHTGSYHSGGYDTGSYGTGGYDQPPTWDATGTQLIPEFPAQPETVHEQPGYAHAADPTDPWETASWDASGATAAHYGLATEPGLDGTATWEPDGYTVVPDLDQHLAASAEEPHQPVSFAAEAYDEPFAPELHEPDSATSEPHPDEPQRTEPHGAADVPHPAATPFRSAPLRGSARNRRSPAKRSALLTVAIPSVAVMGVTGIAAAGVSGVGGQNDESVTTQAAPDPSSVKPAAANSKLDTQLSTLAADADDFGDRVSRTQERIDLKQRQAEEKKRKEAEAARKEALRPKFALPVEQNGLSATYGQAGVNWMSLHSGIDFPVSNGTPVRAATDGTIRTQWDFSFGNMAIVTAPDGTETWYNHLSSTKFRSGSVQAGDVIAYSGSSGNSTGPHLHFEVHPGGAGAVDPLPWLRSHGLDPS